MKLKFFFVGLIAAVAQAGFASGQTTRPSAASSLVDLLPASNVVVSIDVQRGLNDALPKLLVGNPAIKAEIDAGLAEMNGKAGSDLSKLANVVVGLSLGEVSTQKPKIDPVFIARGDIAASQVVASATKASKTPCTESTVAGKTLYLCQMEVTINVPAANGSPATTKKVLRDTSFVALDANTFAFGEPSRVKQMLVHETSVSPTIKSLLKDSPTTVAAFSMESSPEFQKMMPIESDDVGTILKGLRYVAGAADSVADGFEFSLLLRNVDVPSAKRLNELLLGFKALGKVFLGSSQRADQRMYGGLIGSVKIAQVETDVSLSIAVPQSTVTALMKEVKIKTK
ncbi:MAG: hypothetical protein UZ17_ACD001000076 [Acidobacteria bacterium OLB17]|nr:MAG: hypothetical protein UZ17_ACD001000076 [Acidobacteria bacterium OLB17]MCZ2391452.1 hypothetical protein [Acidobacteriota bacterium]